MTDLRKCAQDVLDKYDSYRETSCNETYSKDMEALRAALAETPEDMPPTCNPHPDAPHGFNRNASHSEDRYVCECEGWEPETPSVDALIAEIDGLCKPHEGLEFMSKQVSAADIQAILDKYRARGGE